VEVILRACRQVSSRTPSSWYADTNGWKDNQKNVNLNLALATITFTGTVDGGKPITGGIEPKGHPVSVLYKVTPGLRLGTLLQSTFDTLYDNGGYNIYSAITFTIIHPIIYMFSGDFIIGDHWDDVKKAMRPNPIDCLRASNIQVCNVLVFDDADSGYNCAAYAGGKAAGGFQYYALIDEASTRHWGKRLGYDYLEQASCFQNNVIIPDAEMVIYCQQNPSGLCSPQPDNVIPINQTDLLYTHIAKRQGNKWISKVGLGPLLQHDSVDDLVRTPNKGGFGVVAGCFIKSKSISSFHDDVNTNSFVPQTFTPSDMEIIDQLISQTSLAKRENFSSLLSEWVMNYALILPGLPKVD